MKPPSTTVIGPNQPIVLAKNSNKIDWEGELAFVIGKGGKYITESRAYEHVAGYTCFNDVSEREIAIMGSEADETSFGQFMNWLNGKWMDTAAPMGPCLVLKDEIEEPHNLRLSLRLNGKIMQVRSLWRHTVKPRLDCFVPRNGACALHCHWQSQRASPRRTI